MTAPAAYTAIRTEGGLLPVDLLSRVAAGDPTVGGLKDADYHLAPGERIGEQITRAWNRLVEAWRRFASELDNLPEGDPAAGATRERWLQPLFHELGQGRLLPHRAIDIDGKAYPISHMWGRIPIHLVGAGTSLDRRQAGVRGAATASPHSMVQELLNRSDDHLWALLSNGRQLRILRDNISLTRQAYLEFDLETIFGNEIYEEFVLLWLVCHESRFDAEEPRNSWLERWLAEAASAGTRALDALRDQVEAAITHLGRGFLAYPDNQLLKKRLRSGDLTTIDYYQQLLRLIYRLIFLLVAEDRGLLFDPSAPEEAQRRYLDYYSLTRLRTIAAGRAGRGPHPDLWRSLTVAMRGLSTTNGCPNLGLPALGSFLWCGETIPDLDGSDIANTDLLAAIRTLTLIADRDARLLRPVDYRNLGADELGGIYEGLLELHPKLEVEAGHFSLETVAGSERKSTGSYYTPEPLIAALLDLSLEHLLDEAARSHDPQTAILALRILDPAVGSGHFLAAAGRRIARRLASARTGDTEPAPEAIRNALRDVVGRCLYGIDVNPMAVELCKVSLWMEGTEPGRPLSFLDSHIVCGNALLGAYPALVDQGVPDEAYAAVFDDDKPAATAWRQRNRSERAGQGRLRLGPDTQDLLASVVSAVEDLERLPDDTVAEVEAKQARYARLQHSPHAEKTRLAADAWCAAFLAAKRAGAAPITQATVTAATEHPDAHDDDIEQARHLAFHYRFLHPHLAFPQILQPTRQEGADSEAGWSGGFDLVLGNPPWDTLSPDRKEFFSAYDPQIRFANKTEQDAIVAELLDIPEIAERWDTHRRDLFASVHFMKNSGRYRLYAPGNLGKGDFNVYRMFVETALHLTRPGGYAAQVLPSGFYGGANAMAIRKELYEHWQLTHVFGFINTAERWFTGVDQTTRFASYVARKGHSTDAINVAFQIRSSEDLTAALAGGTTRLALPEIIAQSPVALAIPEILDAGDAALVARMSGRWPAFGSPAGWANDRHYQRELDLGTDRDLFGDYPDGLPVYEGRMVDQFDHRAKAYRSGRGRAAIWETFDFGNPDKAIIPQWRLPPANIPSKLGDRLTRYRVGWCDVTAPRNERSLVAALIPPGVICGHSLPTILCSDDLEWTYLPWLAVANSFCADFLVRKKVTLHVTFSILDSLPFPRFDLDDPAVQRIARLALRLTCTSPEMTDYWNRIAADQGWGAPVEQGSGPPGITDPDTRGLARAEIDAIVARCFFDLSRDELASILDTFPVLQRRQERLFGSFRTKSLILRQYDTLAAADDLETVPSVLDGEP